MSVTGTNINLTLRQTKGSELTYAELDGNQSSLKTAVEGHSHNEFAADDHNHDTEYDAIGAASSAVNGHTTVFDHNLLHAPHSDDQDLSGYSLATHNHTGTYEPANANIQQHISSTSNPHSVTATQVGLGNVLNATQEVISAKGQALGYCPLDGGAKVSETYLPDSVLGQVDYQGTWNATTNVPVIPAASTANKGWYYIVATSGTTTVDGITDWTIGDWIISNGVTWNKVDNTDSVSSVFGRAGAIAANAGDYNASQITNTPAGNIAAVTVQAAINELDTEKASTTDGRFVTNGDAHDHVGGDGAKIDLTAAVAGILPIANGGTGSSTQNFVDLTTNQTIAGNKTFTGNTTLGDAEATDTHSIKGATTLLANSSSAALTVTQTGTGSAFVVEDSTSPDATPFVITSGGAVVVGHTASVASGSYTTPKLHVHQINNAPDTALSAFAWGGGGTTSPRITLARSNSATIGSHTALVSGSAIGSIEMMGSDGSAFIPAASIAATADGTPGTNNMPGRLVFSTTADGASTPTERMRIDSAGRVGIGATANAAVKVDVAGILPSNGGVTGGIYSRGTVPSSTTTEVYGIVSQQSTEAASFVLPNMYRFFATQGAIGAGSSIVAQYGFYVSSGLISATNNYGFYGAIPSGTNRWNLYMGGTAINYLNGALLIGNTVDTGEKLQVNGSAKATQWNVSAMATAPASATDTGTLGEIRITATHIYVCTATNTWVRAALSTW